MRCSRTAKATGSLCLRTKGPAADCSGEQQPLQMRSCARPGSSSKKRFWMICAIYLTGICLSAFDDVPFVVALRHLIAPSIARGEPQAIMFARIVIVAGALLVFLGAGLQTWGAAYLRTEVVHDTAQHSQALVADGPFRYTRNPLYLANPADGGWNRRPGQPFRIYFSCTGKLDFCLSTDSSRRRIPAENPRGIISGILPSGPALLARVKVARFAGKSRAPTGARPSRERVLSGCSVSRTCWSRRLRTPDSVSSRFCSRSSRIF